MSYKSILVNEISALIGQLMAEKRLIDPRSVTTMVCTNHHEELSEEAPFSTHNNYTNVRREVTAVMSKALAGSEGIANGQLIIEGMQFVQKYYSVERNGERVGVPVDQMSAEEVTEKVELLHKMGDACHSHADELLKYMNR